VVDVFIIFTDQPCSSVDTDEAVTPVKALHQYCDIMSRPNTRYTVFISHFHQFVLVVSKSICFLALVMHVKYCHDDDDDDDDNYSAVIVSDSHLDTSTVVLL